MTARKRRKFDIDAPEELPVDPLDESTTFAPIGRRRSPMAAAIAENARAVNERAELERQIRAENDALAAEYARLEREGLIAVRAPLDQIRTTKIARDRKAVIDDEGLAELAASIRAVGLANPIRVMKAGDGFELVQGLRRLRAFERLRDGAHDEDERTRWSAIPAALYDPSDPLDVTYRKMVDENLVREDVSFAEMAQLALRYARDRETDASDVDAAVRILFASASYAKRSHIRGFAHLIEAIGDCLDHPECIARNLGLETKKALERRPERLSDLRAALRDAETWEAEHVALKRFIAASARPEEHGGRAARPVVQNKAAFEIKRKNGVDRLAVDGRSLAIEGVTDFGSIEQATLERAIAAFYATLDRG